MRASRPACCGYIYFVEASRCITLGFCYSYSDAHTLLTMGATLTSHICTYSVLLSHGDQCWGQLQRPGKGLTLFLSHLMNESACLIRLLTLSDAKLTTTMLACCEWLPHAAATVFLVGCLLTGTILSLWFSSHLICFILPFYNYQ